MWPGARRHLPEQVYRGVFTGRGSLRTDERMVGFSNRWYLTAIETAQPIQITGRAVRIVTPALFIATKLEAFHGRGNDDVFASHDIEDRHRSRRPTHDRRRRCRCAGAGSGFRLFGGTLAPRQAGLPRSAAGLPPTGCSQPGAPAAPGGTACAPSRASPEAGGSRVFSTAPCQLANLPLFRRVCTSA